MRYSGILAVAYAVFAAVFVVFSVPIATSSGPIGLGVVVVMDLVVVAGTAQYARRWRAQRAARPDGTSPGESRP